MEKNDIVIVAAKRTPMGAMLGSLSDLSAPELGAAAHKAALEQAGISSSDIQLIRGDASPDSQDAYGKCAATVSRALTEKFHNRSMLS